MSAVQRARGEVAILYPFPLLHQYLNQHLIHLFSTQIDKTYIAKVANRLELKSQVISAPMGPDPLRTPHQVKILRPITHSNCSVDLFYYLQYVDRVNGKDAVTYVELLESCDDASDGSEADFGKTSYVKLMPVTGR